MENLTLDFNNFGSRVGLGTYEKCDSLTLTIMLDEKDYTGYKFKIVAKKSDGHIIEQDIKEQDINREEKIINLELHEQFTTKEGVVKLEINMIKEGKEDTTKEAFFIVRDTINGEVVESTSIIPTLEGVKVFIDEAVSSLGDLEQAGEEIALINGEFKEAEIKRKSSELLRERSEKERVRLESIRTTEEADRIKAEAERKEAENNRKVAENNRKLNENTRKTNEAARVEAELNRQSLFEENEEIRNENEKLRIEAEKERKLTFSNNNKFESERVEAEKLRVAAEDKRVTSEKARAKAEEERIKAETRREGTYTDFNDSEVERKNNEANRVRAEAERVNAESGRNELFNSNEEKRNNTFVESERARERAFNEAQTNRSEAYEESERVREEAFKVSESARNEAEEVRKETELSRVEAENNRKVAESKRVKAESARVEAEKLRVSAETERVEAENLRVTSEEGRVAAETKREEGFNKFEGKINSNTEELKNARSATTGEKFDTLDERIDCEVDRLNKKIEVSMLQQEDKESHVIENTVDGMTTDMVVKGRTLQNLWNGKIGNNIANKIKGETTYTIIITNCSKNTSQLNGKWVGSSSPEDFLIKPKGNQETYYIARRVSPVNANNLSFYFVEGGEDTQLKILILEDDWINKPIPQYFEGIKSFGEAEGNKISILSSGKNLFNVTFEKGMAINSDSGSTYVQSNRDLSGFQKVPSNTQLILSGGIFAGKCLFNKNKKFIKSVATNNFTTTNDTYYIRFAVDNTKEYNVQLEKGTVATSYQESQQDKKDILLSELGFDEGLRGLSLSVCDELNDIENVAIKRIEKIVINDINVSEIQDRPNAQNTNWFQTDYISNTSVKTGGLNINNKLIGVTETQAWNDTNDFECLSITGTSSGARIKGRVNKGVTSEQIKERLKGLIVYYELAEPVETPLTESIALKIYDEKTYVSFENALSGTSSFKAPVDTTATIARLNRENRALEEENVKLKKGAYISTKDISITKEELQATQSAVDFLLFNNLNAVETAMLYNGKKEGGGSMGAYLAMRIIKGKLKYDAVMKQYGEFKEDIDLILEAEGYGHLITQQ
ncbi:hypothetical protein KLF37_07025 [Clostridium perfringens]|uniref:hypothetical protein n=1 Tax=Clostridium perfringens TaxID=1502 RepID=UPI001CCBDC09|nr:hypothetical protein [Clostridium perfringens]UBK93070.1 hypothetical protein KLF37_07025 [Clostridium perfringens]